MQEDGSPAPSLDSTQNVRQDQRQASVDSIARQTIWNQKYGNALKNRLKQVFLELTERRKIGLES